MKSSTGAPDPTTPPSGAPVAPFTPNEHLTRNRERKAEAMARWACCLIGQGGIEVDDLASPEIFTDKRWAKLAELAGVEPPHSQATKNLVVEYVRRNLRIEAEVKGTDPLSGLPRA